MARDVLSPRLGFASALVLVFLGALLTYRALDRAADSTRRLAHTQEVLAAIEASRIALVDTDVRRAQEALGGQADRLTGLTADNSTQQELIRRLRHAIAGQPDLLEARTVLFAMRAEEGRLLSERIQADATALWNIRLTMLGIFIAAGVLLAWVYALLRRDVRRGEAVSTTLQRANDQMTAEAAQRSKELHDTNERLRSIVDSAVDAIIVIDTRGRMTSANPAAERLFGYTQADIIGQNVSMLMPAPYHDEHDGYIARYLETHEPRIIGKGRQVTGRRKDGSTFPVHLSVGEMSIGGERQFTGILHDLTIRVGFETQLREQAALARLGEMAAVLAHEIRNPLAAIRAAIQVIGGRLPNDSREAQVMRDIIARVDALNGLMRELLLFARPPQPNTTPVDLAPLLANTAQLLKQDPALSHIDIHIDGNAPPVTADPDLLTIVFQNLLINGAHAMDGQGTLRVSIRTTPADCQVVIADNGPGIPADIRENIFRPFFTTKARGTGLGLPTAKRIIEAHLGRILVECPPAGGTTFVVQLPR